MDFAATFFPALKALQENSQTQGLARHLVDRKCVRALKGRHPVWRAFSAPEQITTFQTFHIWLSSGGVFDAKKRECINFRTLAYPSLILQSPIFTFYYARLHSA
ncbi:MAG: hypothetical protein ABIZ95_07750 [Pyrinomonadaceae bacterium]